MAQEIRITNASWAKVIVTALLGLLHATFVIAGIYVAINGRITSLEVKMDVLWGQMQKAIERLEK